MKRPLGFDFHLSAWSTVRPRPLSDTNNAALLLNTTSLNVKRSLALCLSMQNWSQEVIKLKAKYEEMERTQRHLLGEDLGPLNLKELQNLEKQLEGALSLARQRKTQIMMEQMEDLRKKERQLGELNKQLKSKLDAEGQSLKTIQSLWGSSTAAESSDFGLHLSHPNPMECDHEPVLQIGYQHYVQAEGSSVSKSMGGEASFIHGWVI
ncbi:hypothetical protein V6N11_012370 [Hibiscus sabdariffa]|uniref:Uncharacterized protein n=2 Tax=Hibiscus sabdariffa TaxID=183260 RepID=A0ABR2QB00_9ROSI